MPVKSVKTGVTGIGLWVGGVVEEVRGGAGAYVVAKHSRTDFPFPVITVSSKEQ